MTLKQTVQYIKDLGFEQHEAELLSKEIHTFIKSLPNDDEVHKSVLKTLSVIWADKLNL